MATTRPFAYNTGSTISNTEQVGLIAIGVGQERYDEDYGGVKWWNGPDEDNGYVIAYPNVLGNQPNPDFISAYLGFKRSATKTENSFVELTNVTYGQSFTTGNECQTYLNNNGYWTSWVSQIVDTGLILNWDIQNISSYSGSGTSIVDLKGNSNGNIVGTIDYTSGSTNYLNVEGSSSEYIVTNTNLNPYLSPVNTGTAISLFVWVYPTGNGIILNEQGTTTPATSWHDSQIEIVSGQLKFRVWQLASPYITSNVALTLNTWNYIGLTYSGTTLNAYLNGANVGTANLTRLTPYNNGGGIGLHYSLGATDNITNMGDGSGGTFRFGAFQVYNIGLNSSDVLTNYNADKSKYGL